MKKDTNISDDNLVMGIFLVTVIFMTIWSALMINDIKRDVKDISATLTEMNVTLTEMTQPQIGIVETDISAEANE